MNSKLLNPGDELKKNYVIKKKLGEGAFGQVYKAFDKKQNKCVALKLVQKKNPMNGYAEALVGEARILMILKECEGTPLLYDYFQHRSFNVMAIELCKTDFYEMLYNHPKQKFSRKVILHLVHHLVVVMEDVHAHGILHRDIKLGNLMLPMKQTPNVKLILSDFGSGCKYESNFKKPGMRLRVPGDDFAFGHSPYTSISMSRGKPANQHDDMEMIAYLILLCLRVQFSGSPSQMLKEKEDFVSDPSKFLKRENSYLIPIIMALVEKNGDAPNYNNVIRSVARETDVPTTRNFIIKRKLNGKITLKDF